MPWLHGGLTTVHSGAVLVDLCRWVASDAGSEECGYIHYNEDHTDTEMGSSTKLCFL